MTEAPGTSKDPRPEGSWRWWTERIIGVLAAGSGIAALWNLGHSTGSVTSASGGSGQIPTGVAAVANAPVPPAPTTMVMPPALVAPPPRPVADEDPGRDCGAVHVAHSPAVNWRGWPVRERIESTQPACHIADGESVNLLCRQGLNAICIDGPDAETSSRCRGYIHTDAFVFGKMFAPEVNQLPRCLLSCPPTATCRIR